MSNIKDMHYDLSGKNLTQIPEEVFKMTWLKSLDIQNNNIAEVPPEIRKLKNLENLNLSNNKLTLLPSNLGKLEKLRYLNVSKNNLSFLPSEISDLVNLAQLDISHNKLRVLPNNMENLKRLFPNREPISRELHLPQFRGLLIENNDFDIPEEVCNNDPQQIISYIYKITFGNPKPLREAKLIFVGPGGVGKTSIVHRLINKDNENLDIRTSLDIEPWTHRDSNLKMHIWDFGGQLIFSSIHHYFLTRRSVYVLVMSTRIQDSMGEEKTASKWIDLILNAVGEDISIIVVYNSTDLHKMDISIKELKRKYPSIVGVVGTCALSLNEIANRKADGVLEANFNDGLNDLKELILQTTLNLKHLEKKFPKPYFKIKNQLEDHIGNYVTHNDYREICKYNGLNKEEEIVGLLDLLNDLGIMLHLNNKHNLVKNSFLDNDSQIQKLLEEIKVLKPKWTTQAIYAIFSDPLVIENKGRVSFQEIRTILAKGELGGKYMNEEEARFIIGMMIINRLAYTAPKKEGDIYYIPAAFESEANEGCEPWPYSSDSTHNIYFGYNFLPSYIIQMFMSEMHEFIEKHSFWKKGVILKYKGARVRIYETNGASLSHSRDYIVIEVYHRNRKSAQIISANMEQILGSINNRLTNSKEYKVEKFLAIIYKGKIYKKENDILPALINLKLIELLSETGTKKYPILIDDSLITIDIKDLLEYRNTAKEYYSRHNKLQQLKTELYKCKKILEDEVEDALEALINFVIYLEENKIFDTKEYVANFSSLKSQYKEYRTDKILGIATRRDLNIQFNGIYDSILKLIASLEKKIDNVFK